MSFGFTLADMRRGGFSGFDDLGAAGTASAAEGGAASLGGPAPSANVRRDDGRQYKVGKIGPRRPEAAGGAAEIGGGTGDMSGGAHDMPTQLEPIPARQPAWTGLAPDIPVMDGVDANGVLTFSGDGVSWEPVGGGGGNGGGGGSAWGADGDVTILTGFHVILDADGILRIEDVKTGTLKIKNGLVTEIDTKETGEFLADGKLETATCGDEDDDGHSQPTGTT